MAIALIAGGLFFPQSQALGLDRTGLSPVLQRKIVYLGAKASFQEASEDLEQVLEIAISAKQVERVTKRIGEERLRERTAALEAFQRLPLVQKDQAAHPDRPVPPAVMASMDGARLQIRSPEQEDTDPSKTHWRESKIGVLETYAAQTFECDPDPDVPRCFLDLGSCVALVSGLGHTLPGGLGTEPAKADQVEEDNQEAVRAEHAPGFHRARWARAERKRSRRGRRRSRRPGRPKRLVRSVVASRCCSKAFGLMLQQAAWDRNFFASPCRVFLGDGQACNWTIQSQHFSTFEPVLDFVHALSYVFAAAMAGRSREEGFAVYLRWIQLVWAGQVALVVSELDQRAAELGAPAKNAPDNDPAKLVAESLGYLRNNRTRMRYDEYRRRGLPIMTSAVESMVKRINRRVKGSEKFWSEAGAEALLQLRGDYLSETNPMERYWQRREKQALGLRRWRRAA